MPERKRFFSIDVFPKTEISTAGTIGHWTLKKPVAGPSLGGLAMQQNEVVMPTSAKEKIFEKTNNLEKLNHFRKLLKVSPCVSMRHILAIH